MNRIAVIGAGPAGLLAAAYACSAENTVYIFDGNEKAGKKLFITGKGRCNITNIAAMDDFISNIPRNPRFLFSCFDGFFNTDIINLLNSNGVPTKVERGGRVFPLSDKSSDVIKALVAFAKNRGVELVLNSKVLTVYKDREEFTLKFSNGKTMLFDCVVIATGGASYPLTGSTGDGYRMAKSLGHTVLDPKPSLVSLVTEEHWVSELAGLSLKNITLSAYIGKKCVYSEFGEMLFTHNGVSGPLVLSASARIADMPDGAKIFIDMKPALDRETLDARILRDLDANKHKHIKNAISGLMPQRMLSTVLSLAGIDPETTTDNFKKSDRRALVDTLKAIPLNVLRAGDMAEAVITRGGVSVKEINPKTMESKLVKGLYFAGEVIDVDGYTGGFNLQIAFSTGVAAGKAISGVV